LNVIAYYEDLKSLARQVRAENGLTTTRVLPSHLKSIYERNGIEIDFWPYKLRYLRGAFLNDRHGTSVMLAGGLPQDPLVFTMAHELKHFFTDRHIGLSYCDPSNQTRPLEVGAEIFASELLFPNADFVKHMQRMAIQRGSCGAETLVRLKSETRTTLSYAALAIKAERLQFAPRASVTKIKTWRALERTIKANRT
jgi:Zn-dependent peptidase ImmA (M78 family)